MRAHYKPTHISPGISTTTHGGFIGGLVIGRGLHSLPTGGTRVPNRLHFHLSLAHLGVIDVVVRRMKS